MRFQGDAAGFELIPDLRDGSGEPGVGQVEPKIAETEVQQCLIGEGGPVVRAWAMAGGLAYSWCCCHGSVSCRDLDLILGCLFLARSVLDGRGKLQSRRLYHG